MNERRFSQTQQVNSVGQDGSREHYYMVSFTCVFQHLGYFEHVVEVQERSEHDWSSVPGIKYM